MEAWTNVGVPLIVALLTSTALWGVVSKVILKRMELTAKRSKADEAQRKMLVGLAHDRIIHLGMVYIERGYVTQDEYENLNDYLYAPYEKNGRQRQRQAGHGGSAEVADAEIVAPEYGTRTRGRDKAEVEKWIAWMRSEKGSWQQRQESG